MKPPLLSPDGRYLSVSVDLDKGDSALAVDRIADMVQPSLPKFPRFEMACQVKWVSNQRLVIARGRKVGSLEKPRPSGEIITSNFGGSRQKYVYAYEPRAAPTPAGNPPPNEGHGFYGEANNIAWFKTLETFLDQHLSPAAN